MSLECHEIQSAVGSRPKQKRKAKRPNHPKHPLSPTYPEVQNIEKKPKIICIKLVKRKVNFALNPFPQNWVWNSVIQKIDKFYLKNEYMNLVLLFYFKLQHRKRDFAVVISHKYCSTDCL